MIKAYRASEGFLFRLVAFIREQFKLSAPRAFSFLAADLRNLLLCGAAGACLAALRFYPAGFFAPKND